MGIGKIWIPEAFQGSRKKRNYFEGWYFKLIDKSRQTVFAIIPGISIGENRKDPHAFVQFIDAVKGKTEYFRFAIDEFKADKNKFDVYIGRNHFSDKSIDINLNNGDSAISGILHFDNIEKYPKSFFNPGIMGPFSFIPCMECYHGIVNIRHTINGCLNLNAAQIDMTGGEGYIEKDWGRSFPESWIWLQANHFHEAGASFMFSVARIPWLKRSFTGLISFLRTDQGFYKFATYNRSRITYIENDGDTIVVRVQSPTHTLNFTADYKKGGILKAPKNGLMEREIEESITAEVSVCLTDRNGNTIFKGSSKCAGMEISGCLNDILVSTS
ncbi:MAG: hypothetical protein EOM62_05830 [Bacteroidia bacterium]|nr:hypothetical protein [Bacteroidia bacterium]